MNSLSLEAQSVEGRDVFWILGSNTLAGLPPFEKLFLWDFETINIKHAQSRLDLVDGGMFDRIFTHSLHLVDKSSVKNDTNLQVLHLPEGR